MAQLKSLHKELILLLIASSGNLTHQQIISIVKERYPKVSITLAQIKELEEHEADTIQTYRVDGKLAVIKALEMGLLKYSHKLSRLLALEKVVDLGVHGYIEQVQTSKGTVVDLRKNNLHAANQALKLIKDEMDNILVENTTGYQINVNLTEPLDQEEEDEFAEP